MKGEGNVPSEERALPLLGDTSEEVSTLLEIIRCLDENRRLSKGQFALNRAFIILYPQVLPKCG